jgi:histidinol dehydrogenase
MKKYYLKKLNETSVRDLCRRKAVHFETVLPIVQEVLDKVKLKGDKVVREYTERFDKVSLSSFAVSQAEIEDACQRLPKNIQSAFEKATKNIKRFQKSQMIKLKKVETMPGATCFTQARPIEKVGLYIPGGTAPLASTVLMLGIPAKLVGCKEIVIATPPGKEGKVADIILFAAKLSGISQIFKIGGAQAIAALAFGTESVPKVYKIFGPGNQYVTAAKMLVSIDPEGAAIDMPSGPTEVLLIADETARADFLVSDLLSQAEHGIDSAVILVTTSEKKANEVLVELE